MTKEEAAAKAIECAEEAEYTTGFHKGSYNPEHELQKAITYSNLAVAYAKLAEIL